VVAEGALYLGTAAPGPAAAHSGVPRAMNPHRPAPMHLPPPVAPPPVMAPFPGQNRPVSGSPMSPAPPHPLHRPVPQPAPQPIPARGRAWYEEPTAIGTVIVLVLVLVAFGILIAAIA
jgi:hypothetical protein